MDRIGTLLSVLLFAVTRNVPVQSDAIILYLPFQVETYGAVTKDDMNCAPIGIKVRDPKKALELLHDRIAVSTRFDGSRVRVAILLPNEESYFVDTNGVFVEDGQLYKLDKLVAKRLIDILQTTEPLYHSAECEPSLKSGRSAD